MSNNFKTFWKLRGDVSLTEKEIIAIQNKIHQMQKAGIPSSKIIKSLQEYNVKLTEKYRAEAAYWTTVKRMDTNLVAEIGSDLGIVKYKVILSPSACPVCINKTNNGRKVFSDADVQKSGYGHVPPFHVNCYCIFYPVA